PEPVVATPVVPPAPVAPAIEKTLDDIVREALKDVGQKAEKVPSASGVVPLAPATELPTRQLEAAPTLPPPTSLSPTGELPTARSALVPPRGIAPRRTAPNESRRRQTPQFTTPEGDGMN
ncbi:MAG: hypothetical protein JKY32_13205, partial [Rhizobiales bacterium]|nr:hypothetical protein [Hyphomicrobiales bacterium]